MKLPTFLAKPRAKAAILNLCVASSLALPVHLVYAGGDQSELPRRLADAKISLTEGISRAGQLQGLPISAKFEMEGKDLHLSVYTAKQGRAVAAENNELIELSGNASTPAWQPEKEIFSDKPHIARAAMQLTVIQQSKLGLLELLKKSAAQHQGTIYSITPDVQNGKPAFKLLILGAQGKTSESWIDLDGNRLAQ
ncbi:MAG: hypothetical protein V4488_03100 [Pseudomonadota bacterium]